MTKPIFVVLFGPPGAGKGTQSVSISKRLGLPHVSTGDIFRSNLKNRTELGKLAEKYMKEGELVPDEVTIRMVREYLQRPPYANGAVLDGFPRTLSQAIALDDMLKEFEAQIAVALIEVPDELVIERLTGRVICRAQGHTFHKQFNPPQKPGICDFDGSELYQRADDSEETVTRRIRVYHEQTMPILNHYRSNGAMHVVDGNQPIERVTEDLLKALPGRDEKKVTIQDE